MRDWQRDADEVHARRWLTLVVLCLSLVVIIVDNSILNVALPTLARPVTDGGLGASDSNLQWIVDAYVLVFAGLLLTAGSLGDRFGRYRALVVGLVVFGVGSAAAAFAGSSGTLIAARAIMGVGGACIMPATLSIITNVFTDPRERGRAIGVWAGVSALGLAVGPVTGGLLLEHFWWGSVLLVNVPIVIVALVAGFFLVPDSRDPAAPRIDIIGALLSIAGLVAVVWALIEGPTTGWGSAPVVGAFAAGVVLLVLFVVWESVSDHPMLDIGFFRNPRFSVACAGITLTFMSLMGMIFMLTQYLQSVLGYTPLKAGVILIPMSCVLLVLAPTSARIVERVGTKAVLGTGLLIVSTALALQTTLEVSSPTIQVIGLTMLLAAGMANVMAPATESIMGSLPRAKAGVGSAVNDTTRQVGGAIGVALLGSLLSSVYRSDVREGLAGTALPPELLDAASSSVQAAVRIGEPAGAAGEHIVTTAHAAFLSGYHLAVLVAAGFTLIGAAAVFLWLPARAPDAGGPRAGAGAPGGDGAVGADGDRTADRVPAGATEGNGQDDGDGAGARSGASGDGADAVPSDAPVDHDRG
jgi:EmrB/QacA subfamily drug resistance transporter